ncbi:hypothetical protein GCM10020000_31990 [Streptomyces olivoverticillatus]
MGCGAEGMVVTLLKRKASGGQRVEIRYGAKCGAVWVRTMGLHVGDRVELSLPGADTKEVRAAEPAGHGGLSVDGDDGDQGPRQGPGVRAAGVGRRGGVLHCAGARGERVTGGRVTNDFCGARRMGRNRVEESRRPVLHPRGRTGRRSPSMIMTATIRIKVGRGSVARK